MLDNKTHARLWKICPIAYQNCKDAKNPEEFDDVCSKDYKNDCSRYFEQQSISMEVED